MANALPAAAPWRAAFLSHLEDMQPPIFTFSTLHPVQVPQDSSSSSSDLSPQLFTPRCRTVVFRGMWAGLPVNPKNTAELNPGVYESDLLTLTSDSRMDKVPELSSSSSTTTTRDEEQLQSGGGAPTEAMFWATKAKTQWRFRGRAYVIGPDIDSEAAAPVRSSIQAFMRETGRPGEFSWSRELTAHFGNLSPGMRGSFRNPPPGTPLTDKPGKGLGLGQKVEDLHDEIARANFRVIVIVPDEVDQVDLTDPAEGRRWNYKLDGSTTKGTWKKTELWP